MNLGNISFKGFLFPQPYSDKYTVGIVGFLEQFIAMGFKEFVP